jgi:poly-gamma-glutamate capsule biosynthesis protein CapA/YwtB (metallophosphatase superfamily)
VTQRFRRAIAAALVAVAIGGLVTWALSPDPPEPAAIVPSSSQAVLVSVGDILLADAAASTLQRHGYGFAFARLKPLYAGADFLMGNLEGPITEHDVAFVPEKSYTYRQPPAVARALRDAGFDALALGNNHALDYGPAGLADTIRSLTDAGVATFGAGENEAAARRGVVVEVKGVRVGLLSYQEPQANYERRAWFASPDRAGVARLDIESVRADIARLRTEADVIIVHAHFGVNYRDTTDYQRRIAREIIDAGADAVNGHHPHVAQGIDLHDGKPILYSLGNFTFGTQGRFGKDTPGYGLVARYRIATATRRIVAVDLDLIATNNKLVEFQPRIVGRKEAKLAWAGIEIGFNARPQWRGSTATFTLP